MAISQFLDRAAGLLRSLRRSVLYSKKAIETMHAINRAAQRLQTQASFNEQETRAIALDLGIAGELPKESYRRGGEPVWTRESIKAWGKREAHCRPCGAVETR